MSRSDLSAAWAELLRSLGAADRRAVAHAFDEVSARYSEPHRRYHTLEHVAEVLGYLEDLWSPAPPPPGLCLAAWLHDVVYDPRRADNEAASAAWATGRLGALGVADDVGREAHRLIELTAGHDPSDDDEPGRVLADADLAILGAPGDRYDRYAAAVREEYGFVPDEDYRAGRSRVLHGFLERSAIYHTDRARAAFEAAARGNLARELAALSGDA